MRSRTLLKNGPKNKNSKKIFWYFESQYFRLLPRQILSKSEKKIFLAAQWSKNGPEMSEKFFSPILTKFGVVIVKNMVIQNIKKKFKIFHFSDHFLTVCANAHCDEQNFLGKFFIFNKNDLVRIWDSSECAFKSWFLVVKLKMGVWQFWPQGGVTPKTDMPPTYQAQR